MSKIVKSKINEYFWGGMSKEEKRKDICWSLVGMAVIAATWAFFGFLIAENI